MDSTLPPTCRGGAPARPDSARFRNTSRHRYDWQDLGANNVLHLIDAEGNTLARAEYGGAVQIPGDPDADA
ncbi:hypothetical protein [Streptomyces sp. NPDC058572]|uniref:hypothetical protein n=1 Tax=Streptomyces sp. NPDC058572 TaxID=3346546 RepID=UPI003651991D